MSDVNLQLVREFFEVNFFHVLTFWQHGSSRAVQGDHSMLLFLENVRPRQDKDPAFVLDLANIDGLDYAVADIRAWHGDRFYPSVIEANPILATLAREETHTLTRDMLNTDEFSTILIISELPKTPEQRSRSIGLLKESGIDHIIEFSTIIEGLLDKISENGNYSMSQTLQLMRLLKRYKFIRNQQMEFTFPTEPPSVIVSPDVETCVEPEDDED